MVPVAPEASGRPATGLLADGHRNQGARKTPTALRDQAFLHTEALTPRALLTPTVNLCFQQRVCPQLPRKRAATPTPALTESLN